MDELNFCKKKLDRVVFPTLFHPDGDATGNTEDPVPSAIFSLPDSRGIEFRASKSFSNILFISRNENFTMSQSVLREVAET